jgi:lantibiotic biosynthesis protein
MDFILNINALLARIDAVIMRELKLEFCGLLYGLGGCSIYFSNRFIQKQDIKFHNYSIDILDSIIIRTNQSKIPDCVSIGVPISASCWIIDQYIKKDMLEEVERCNSQQIIDYIIASTTKDETQNNFHDLFYGFIGKAIILIENDSKANWGHIKKIVETLEINAIKDKDGIYWNTPDPFFLSPIFEKTVNFGVPHGSCGIILFLLKCCDVYNLQEELKPLLKGSIVWIINRLEKENNKLLYSYSTKPSGSGKLGWCYGDQAIAYTLLRYSETFNCEKAKAKAYELIEQAAAKPIEQTGVQYYPKYGYYDMRVCHGTSSVAYMWLKMYHITKDENIKTLADKWLNITLDNLDIFLPQLDKISELEKDNDKIDTSMGFLNGLSGVGLVLMSFLDPKLSDWDKLLLLDRPGRE